MFATPHSSSSVTKSKKNRSSLPLQRLQATWAAKCAEQIPKLPSLTLPVCYSVYVELQAPAAVKMLQQENQQLEVEERVSTAAIMKTMNSKEQAKELVNINKEQDAGRALRANTSKAILAKARQK